MPNKIPAKISGTQTFFQIYPTMQYTRYQSDCSFFGILKSEVLYLPKFRPIYEPVKMLK